MSAISTNVSDFKGPRGQLQLCCSHCNVCNAGSLSLCTGCRIVRYCCREHQATHWPKHKEACKKIKKHLVKVNSEESKIRNATADFMTPANAFETHAGHFWGLLHTRDYMRARFFLADTMRRTGTLEGVQQGLDHLSDMMRLCRSDNLGVRQMIPALMLQLDKDQEAYDFIKWYQTEGQRDDYDWGNMDLPFLSVKNADVFEHVSFMEQTCGPDAHHCSALILLKLKVLVDLLNIRLTRKILSGKLPIELWQEVELAVIRSPLSVPLTMKPSEQLVAIKIVLVKQIKCLGSDLRQSNDNVITGLLDPDPWLTDIPATMAMHSPEEMQILLQHSFQAWWQHEGALELVRAAQDIAAAESESEIEGMMTTSTFKNGEGSDRTHNELLNDVSLNLVWGYFYEAVLDAGSLSKERPSKVRRKERRRLWEEAEAEEKEYKELMSSLCRP